MSHRWKFLLRFALLLALFELPLLTPPVDRYVARPISAGIAATSAAVLRVMHEKVAVTGTIMAAPCFAVDIQNGCNGIETMLFLVAAVLAFPATARQRLIATLLGILLIQAVNLIRVTTLYLVGCHRREWFESFHLAIWQTIVFATAVLFFAAWSRRVVASA
ncbi:MAG TPA: exosortase H [Thermoanaerobaculia bacterium]|nr:exosortase H [Thermoanaerobaculia bacterium]